MAKKRKKRGKIERELDTIDISLNSILEQYPQMTKKERKEVIKDLKSKSKKALKSWEKSGSGQDYFNFKSADAKLNRAESNQNKIPIKYGIFNYNIDRKYFGKLKKKEQYLDGLFSRSMKKVLNEYEAPTTTDEAKALEGLITQYSKKVKDTKFYDPHLVENSINKLTSFRNKINDYEYSDYIGVKKDIIYDEIDDFESGTEIGDYYEEETGEVEEIYKAIEQPILIDDMLLGINFNFF